jgi:pilus assembly protein CpaB
MRKKRLVLILLMAVTSGIIAGYLALDYLQNQPVLAASTQPEQPRNRIALAVRDLPQGAILREEDVRVVSWGASELPAGYAASAAELVGRGLIAPVRANEPLLASKLADRESGGGLPILIQDGMRAVSVRVDEVVGVAGFVIQGTRVDVMVTIDQSGSSSGGSNPITRVVLQNVPVLAAGQTYQNDEEGKPQTVSVVTLLVSPEDGEKLVLASNQGRIQLALRGVLDNGNGETRGARVANLVNPSGSTQAAPSTRARQVAPTSRQTGSTTIETIRGGQRTLNTFSGNE